MHILLLNGPNLNLTGVREQDVYGSTTLAEIEKLLTARASDFGIDVTCIQSNCEGALIDALHNAMNQCDGVILNPGALSHYSYALRDAIAASNLPAIEVHMSNISAREPFRSTSVLTPVCKGSIVGLGYRGYLLALEYFASIYKL
ncbi:MAG: type II 3-dehydroquinate dehydratase [Candidatus Gastranaerophilaceae bacterium]|jgi:3-dehydroquinate dehydratase-2|nr:type II 3-dehydroquinate dehydratase [Christensenellales bacterium]